MESRRYPQILVGPCHGDRRSPADSRHRYATHVPSVDKLRAAKRAKKAVRERVWALLEGEGAARFPGARGRIPNFVGAEAAAERLAELPEWKRARVVKANPDAPQLPVRARALAEGKLVYMAVPRLTHSKPFMLLDPSRLKVPTRRAASIRGAAAAAAGCPSMRCDPSISLCVEPWP